MSGENPRQIAARILDRHGRDAFHRVPGNENGRGGTRPYQRELAGDYIETSLDRELAKHALSPADRRLCQELVFGVVRWQGTLDWLIARKTANRAQKPQLQTLLRLGLYQIFWLERIPPHAAVHETVEQARRDGFGPQSGFVNAVLRGYLREADATRVALEDLKRKDPAVGYSHPGWLVRRWEQRWGKDLPKLLAWNNTPPPTFARVNTLKTDPGKLLAQWRGEDVEYDFPRFDWLEENLVFELKSHPPLTSLPSFQQGCFYIQDPSTLLAVRELAPRPGETVVDFCAAPGGKLTYIAQLMANEGRLVAQDTSPARLKLVQENCARLGVTCVETVCTKEGLDQAFSLPQSDRVLLDAPCSNTGVMRRRVDLRWRITPEEIERLTATQTALLHQAAALVKPGGTLVYSTCSLEPEENQQLVQAFLRERPRFSLEAERELVPFRDGADGAYVVKVRRKP